ncbi:ATP-binding cassette domain-containing protein [Streptomyces sp. 3MP-14]|uniref:ATP-binding cassette domain-containing protein n=1 Tax=Streptomyces mimosae TaxID=2586635 RepID=A0A5N6A0I6_9ACTN|nr:MULTISPECIES: ABC transporter ATP-binding protein [Streptomyces]KAB8161170.1 ATP-binding cassette domain-containing protein [Streptomyces mimosae]KAB8178981.1 ATP-binding cassette domain-containing protein [Streptomyces sp. 3MP-14]
MAKTPDPPGTATNSPPTVGDVVLEARAISKHFAVRRTLRNFADRNRPVVHAVDDVSLKLRRGSVTAVVGESGSGKSTIARLLAQLYPTTSGQLLLHGKPTKVGQGRAFRAYCRQVQLIFQDPFGSLNPTHTVRYHLTRALRIHNRAGRTAKDLEQALAQLLERVHLTPPERYLDSFPHELSGGQRQRVAIARAMAADPSVLLADEPVSMLDVSIRLGILNLLRDLKERLNLAILYITHDIASARYFADETLVMYAGRMVEGGDSETVTQRPAHPYTQLLTSSAPDPDRIVADHQAATTVDPAGGEVVVEEEESETAGEPPSLISPPSGCRFHPRCPKAMERCRTQVPPRFDLADGQWAACWLYAEDAPARSAPQEASA